MVIFHSYVSLPEGTDWTIQILLDGRGLKGGTWGLEVSWMDQRLVGNFGEAWTGLGFDLGEKILQTHLPSFT